MANKTPHKTKIIHKFQDCCHIIKIEHTTDISKLSCTSNCKSRLPCGHSCPKKCHISDKSNHSLIKCAKKCQKIICKNNHRCPLMCWQECSNCIEMVLKERSCGHKVIHPCSQEITEKCIEKCNRILSCSHQCKQICSERCGDCQEIVDKKLECGHVVKAACSTSVNQLTCDQRCEKILMCGHKCQNRCGDICTTQSNCNQPCNATLPCQHICQGTCNECRQGRLHVPCQNQCNKPLICGHFCCYPCLDTCPPCTEHCLTKCRHSECPNDCYVDCANCMEQCEWKCVHYQCGMLCHEMCDRPRCNEPCLLKLECGHQCIGLCGEDCPNLCRICNWDELKEFELSARFIELVDCGHCIEVSEIDKWMDTQTEEVKMKKCPRCKSIIWISNRYGNVIKKQFSEIAKLKTKIYGRLSELKKRSEELITRIKRSPEVGQYFQTEVSFPKICSYNQLNLFENQFNILLYMAKLKATFSAFLRETEEEYFTAEIDFLINRLVTSKNMNSLMLDDICDELTRVKLQTIIRDKKCKLQEYSYYHRKASQVLSTIAKLTAEEKNTVLQCLYEIFRSSPKVLSEIMEVARLWYWQPGYWCKCPNGHIFPVAEYGNGNCITCGIAIEGISGRASDFCIHRCTENCEQPCLNKCKHQIFRRGSCNHMIEIPCYLRTEPVRKIMKFHAKYQPCHLDMATVKCKVLMMRELKCDHKVKLECHIDYENYKCLVEVIRTLPHCDHEREMLCHEDVAKINCKVNCGMRLDCGHACPRKCHPLDDPDHEKTECKKKCEKTCTRGHKCKNLCYQSCSECMILVDKERSCGHMVKHPCSEELVDKVSSKCTAPCLKMLLCGHRCPKNCGQSCETKCTHPIVRRGNCGHSIETPCHLRNDPERKFAQFCQVPCGTLLPCEHECKGTCGDCRQGRIHVPCQRECGRIKICGHSCTFPCATLCPPCNRKCMTQCAHSKCPMMCGQPCKKCKEKCTWRCPHKSCTALCGEMCDRDRCDEPCRELLPCNHPCVGLCGEICPNLCRVCNRAELTEFILFGFEEEPDARFIQLPDCGHCIEVQGLDHWMEMSGDGDRSIQMKECPRCKTTIWKCSRYGNIIKERIEEIQQVKKRVFGKSLKLLRKIMHEVHMDINRNVNVQQHFSRETNKLVQILTGKRAVHQNQLTVIQNQVEILKLMSKMKEKFQKDLVSTGAKDFFKDEVDFLVNRLMKNEEKMNEFEINDIKKELVRASLNTIFLDAEERTRGTTNITTIENLNRARVLLTNSLKLTEEDEKKVEEYIRRAADLVPGLGITNAEKEMIVKSTQLGQGHWYKCPNGHVYAIGECGGAIQRGRCPDCGAGIGGTSFQLDPGNAHAGIMDGSSHAAWSEYTGLGNYDLAGLV